jgi:asparagine synthase (glutamine-hydrolysing)
VIYCLETYEPELVRSSIPNYFLARLAGAHTKVVLTGEGADELFGGYLYFRDCPSREAMQVIHMLLLFFLLSQQQQQQQQQY